MSLMSMIAGISDEQVEKVIKVLDSIPRPDPTKIIMGADLIPYFKSCLDALESQITDPKELLYGHIMIGMQIYNITNDT